MTKGVVIVLWRRFMATEGGYKLPVVLSLSGHALIIALMFCHSLMPKDEARITYHLTIRA